MKFDWFYLVIGIGWLIFGVAFFIRNNDWFILIFSIFVGMMNLLKLYFQERISILRFFKNKNEPKTQKIMDIIVTIMMIIAITLLILSIFGVI